MHGALSPRRRLIWMLSWLALLLTNAAVFTAQKSGMESSQQRFTGYPPSVYMQFFRSCPSGAPCTRTDSFQVDPVPVGCCLLLVTNGDGQGNDEARSYEVFLNGDKIPLDHSRNTHAPVKVQRSNKIKVVLTGEPHSKVFILIAYDAQQSK